MSITYNTTRAREHLTKGDLRMLFIEELGWDRLTATLSVIIDGLTWDLHALAQKRGMIAYECKAIVGQSLPTYNQRRRIENQVAKSAHEHLIVFTDADNQKQVWQWVKRELGKPTACREHTYHHSQPGDALLCKLNSIAFSLEEEDRLSLPVVTQRTRAGFDVEKVTKRFYDRFQKEHASFLSFITGITESADREWYASVMLNRLMFVYFIQKKGFLDGDHNYLRNRLTCMREEHGKDKFYSFYRYFLLQLFHDGLGKLPEDRKLNTEMEKHLGKVPYLNGGFFEVHQLEEHNPDIDIPDTAFEKLFDFFDQYSWHLDERPLRADNEINPDVVGFIFEKYINQKQMGAYYTKEDITEYISKNTIIPFLFNAAQKKCAIAFQPDSALWRLLRDDPDRYIYPAVRYGVLDDKGNVIELPKEIEAGVKDVAQRSVWNNPIDGSFGLPTETWREHVARRQRCLDIRTKLSRGDVHEINDLVTLNLDIWQFARDAIINTEGPELLRAFWHSIEKVTVLDPTCGSGAFLFAALRILETLYSDCLERMERFVEDLANKPHHPEQYSDFRKVLEQLAKHFNEGCFILKSIIINNLFGVDIMEEAVEICKLRLFLKLVAQVETVGQIEPLPDIDFNIRAGNTLVGFTSLDQVRTSQEGTLGFGKDQIKRIEEDAEIVERAFKQYRAQQTTHGGKVTRKDKQELRTRLAKLEAELDRYLAGENGVNVEKQKAFDDWKASHEPFHWFVEFYGIMHTGGFDIVIGNPPYVAVSKVAYLSPAAYALRIPDLYGHVLLRSLEIASQTGRFGMIVPLSITFSEDFEGLRNALLVAGMAWFSSYDNIPAALFAGVSQRCTIWLGDHAAPSVYVTPVYRWRTASRGQLIPTIMYTEIAPEDCAAGIPKIASPTLASVIRMFYCNKSGFRDTLAPTRTASAYIGFSPSARNFVSAYRDPPPCLDDSTLRPISASDHGMLGLADKENIPAVLVASVGELFFHHWLTWGDGFHVTSGVMSSFIQILDRLPDEHMITLRALGECLLARSNEALVFKRNAGKYVGNYNYRGHAWITRRADLTVMAGLGVPRDTAMEVFSYVQRVLAINEFAGEKSIPDAVKAKYKPVRVDEANEQRVTAKADTIIMQHFGICRDELEYLLVRDTTYSPGGRDG